MRPLRSCQSSTRAAESRRQAARLAGDVADQRRRQVGLDPQARPARRQLDRPAPLIAAHRPDENLVGADEPGEVSVLGAAAVEVGPDCEHDDQALVGVAGTLDERVEERLPLGRVAAGGEYLLELVDREHQPLVRR